MPERADIDIRPDHWEIVRSLLQKHVPLCEVWAFGSRAKWTAKDYSDLDLAVITSQPLALSVSASLSDDFSESDLPWKVDVVDWASTSESFRKIIARDKVVLQSPGSRRVSMSSEGLASPIECPDSWRLGSLKSICKKIGSGATPTGGQAAYQKKRTNFALIRSQNVFDREFSEAGLAFISDVQADSLRGVHLQKNDILINITGDGITFGRACLVPENALPACVNQHVSVVRVDSQQADPGYVVSYLTHPTVKSYIESFNAGGSRRAITKAHIESFVVPLPPLETQSAIANLLGALDDRITLLRETNATLEAIAQALFKSWFVDFDPVHAKLEGRAPEGMDEATARLFPDSFEESELGLVPRGWRVARVDEFMELAYGKALKATDRIAGAVPVYGSGGITGFHNESLVTGPSIIIGRKGTVGSLYWEDQPFFAIDTVFYVRTVNPMTYCFYLLQTLSLTEMNTDAAVPGLNRGNVYRLTVAFPGAEILAAFDALFGAIRERIFSNSRQIQTLATLRDTLLPRLISGQLRLPEAQAAAEVAAA